MKSSPVCICLAAILIVIGTCVSDCPAFTFLDLSDGWSFRKVGEEEYHPAIVPGCIHTDLLKAGIIDPPFEGCNEKDLQWIEVCDWEYKRTISFSGHSSPERRFDLVFDGIDTWSDVFLNDSLLISTDNMFRQWRVDCTDLMIKGENELKIIIRSAPKIEKVLSSSLSYTLPGGDRVFSRKAAFHYGWDWGPRFVTGGIWRAVRIESRRGARIVDARFSLVYVDQDRADYEVDLDIDTDIDRGLRLTLDVGGMRTPLKMICPDDSVAGDSSPPAAFLDLEPLSSKVRFSFSIFRPRLWWPAGMGKQHLYRMRITLSGSGETSGGVDRPYDYHHQKIGIRTVELIDSVEEDTIGLMKTRVHGKEGSPFYFLINGKPVFMKGANYIPRSSFPGDDTAIGYEEIISDAVESNMNMLRVWGGGIYEDDRFYDLCDEQGILVWQDFMFACAMYPWDDAFLRNVREEAVQNVRRLSGHPCLALWCGNNEIDEAWHNWGWQSNFDARERIEIWKGYEAIFHELLPEVVEQYGNGIPYHPSSPMFGRGDTRSLSEGDCHYWGVWHDAEPFEVLLDKTGRFMSEFGFQSFPDPATIYGFASEDQPGADSPSISCHQKHPRGNSLILEYMERDFPVPVEFDDFTHLSQLVQARGVTIGIEAQRRAAPYCMGSLYWQLNDCWPVVSWSSIDFTGRRKALYHHAKKALAPVVISPVIEDGLLKVYILDDRSISDGLRSLEGELLIETIHFDGFPRRETTVGDLVPSTVGPCFEEELKAILIPSDHGSTVLRMTWSQTTTSTDRRIIAERLFFPSRPAEMVLPDPGLEFAVFKSNEGYRVELETRKLAKNVYLSFDGVKGVFSDNYFDMAPGSTGNVIFRTDSTLTDPRSFLTVRTLYDMQP